jgi:hypothetical protein
MMDRAFEDFRLLVQSFIDNASAGRVLRRYIQGTHTTNLFKLKTDFNRALIDNSQEWLYCNTDASGTTKDLAVQSGATNYVEVRILTTNDDLQTRAFWDTDIGITGQEFFDTINVRTRLDEDFSVNQAGFQGGSWIPLFEVVVDGSGNITSVLEADDPFWKPRSFALPSAAARADVYVQSLQDLRTYIDFMGAINAEMKGTGQAVESQSWSSLKLLREYQNIFFSNAGDVSWEIAAVDTLRFTDILYISIAGRSTIYEVGAAGNNDFVLTDGQCLYVSVPEANTPVSLTPTIAALSAVPVDPLTGGFDPKILVLFYRNGNKIYGLMDIPELQSGESVIIGSDLDKNQKARLGLTGSVGYVVYPSTINILANDDYPTAIGKLDAAIGGILSDTAQEEEFTVGVGGQTIFDLSTITMDASNGVPDVTVRVNGILQRIDTAGGLTKDFRKNSTTEIEFSYTVPEDAVVVVRQERTGGGGGGGTDLQNITVDMAPSTNGGQFVGQVAKAFAGVRLKDTTSAQVYEITVVSGVLTITPVP